MGLRKTIGMVKLWSLIWVYMFFWAGSMAQNEKRPANKHTIYVSSISWHTGVVVPAYALPDSLWAEDPDYKSSTYLEIGWGDADFYTHEGFNLWYAFKAVFWPTSSVLHLNPIDRKVENYYTNTDVVRIELNGEQFEALCLFLVNQFERDKNGKIIPAAEGIYPSSQFYKGSKSYYFPNNSNVWAARALKRAGLPIGPLWHQTTGSVLNKAEEFGELVVQKDK